MFWGLIHWPTISNSSDFHSWTSSLTAGKIKTSTAVSVTQRSWEAAFKKAYLTKWCSLTPFSPIDGWVILYTINPSICQLLWRIWGWGGRFQELSSRWKPSCITAACNYTTCQKIEGTTHLKKKKVRLSLLCSFFIINTIIFICLDGPCIESIHCTLMEPEWAYYLPFLLGASHLEMMENRIVPRHLSISLWKKVCRNYGRLSKWCVHWFVFFCHIFQSFQNHITGISISCFRTNTIQTYYFHHLYKCCSWTISFHENDFHAVIFKPSRTMKKYNK